VKRPALLVVAVVAFCAAFSACARAPVAHSVEGAVVNEDGAGESGCTVTVEVIRGGPVGETALVADNSGHFSWPVPAGEYWVIATCDDASGETIVEVSSESTELRIVVD
jgi:hypothetical protein